MSDSKAEAEKKIAGQRKAIREHIAKYHKFLHEHEKKTALKTIQLAQGIIRELRKPRLKNIPAAPEDGWEP